MVTLLEEGATNIGVATDHVVESFRNDLYEGYKTGEDMDPVIKAQFQPLEDGLRAVGVATFPMVAYEADDAMAAIAKVATADPRVAKVLLCTPDKDLAQCVEGDRVVQFDRRNNKILNDAAVVKKYGVEPASIPDYLALMGDSADGFPGLSGWGAKTASTLLARYGHIENIPTAAGKWDITVRGSARLAATLKENIDDALLFKKLATLAVDAPTIDDVDDLQWSGPGENLAEIAETFDAPDLVTRVQKLHTARGG